MHRKTEQQKRTTSFNDLMKIVQFSRGCIRQTYSSEANAKIYATLPDSLVLEQTKSLKK